MDEILCVLLVVRPHLRTGESEGLRKLCVSWGPLSLVLQSPMVLLAQKRGVFPISLN